MLHTKFGSDQTSHLRGDVMTNKQTNKQTKNNFIYMNRCGGSYERFAFLRIFIYMFVLLTTKIEGEIVLVNIMTW